MFFYILSNSSCELHVHSHTSSHKTEDSGAKVGFKLVKIGILKFSNIFSSEEMHVFRQITK